MRGPFNRFGIHFDPCHLFDVLVSQPKGPIGPCLCHYSSDSRTKRGLCNVQRNVLRAISLSTILIIIVSPLYHHWPQNGQDLLVPIFFEFKHLPLLGTQRSPSVIATVGIDQS